VTKLSDIAAKVQKLYFEHGDLEVVWSSGGAWAWEEEAHLNVRDDDGEKYVAVEPAEVE
jgi:hypothetical protein